MHKIKNVKMNILLWIVVKMLEAAQPQDSQELEVRINPLRKVILSCDN